MRLELRPEGFFSHVLQNAPFKRLSTRELCVKGKNPHANELQYLMARGFPTPAATPGAGTRSVKPDPIPSELFSNEGRIVFLVS